MTRQLALPGLPPDRSAEPSPLRARRDLSAEAFARELERHGFVCRAGGLRFIDITGTMRASIDGVVRADPPVRLARRATLAKLLRARTAAERSAP